MLVVFTVYPAIDVRDGRVVRLRQGDYAQETRYSQSPLTRLKRYADEGAQWVHLVDLDAARDGGYALLSLLQEIKRETTLHIQTGGGVRSPDDVERILEAGGDRVVIGSLAIADPNLVASWLTRFGSNRLTLALDARCDASGRWYPATHGWTRPGKRTLGDLVRFYNRHGLRHLLCTDIDRDGMLTGSNLAMYRLLRQWAPQVELQASGGVSELDDLCQVRELGCSGIVLGKALLEERITLAQALTC
jgi:phosphoribosylformimino-5-aminoimidazole carboxamide ribotide isomerase